MSYPLTVKVRILKGQRFVDNGLTLLGGMTYRCSPTEAAYLVDAGVAEAVGEAALPSFRSLTARREAAAALGPIGR